MKKEPKFADVISTFIRDFLKMEKDGEVVNFPFKINQN